jgi:hypothetical protein
MNIRKTKISERYDMFLEPWYGTNLCKARDHMITQPIIKFKILS